VNPTLPLFVVGTEKCSNNSHVLSTTELTQIYQIQHVYRSIVFVQQSPILWSLFRGSVIPGVFLFKCFCFYSSMFQRFLDYMFEVFKKIKLTIYNSYHCSMEKLPITLLKKIAKSLHF
jgi:hypothetical protein